MKVKATIEIPMGSKYKYEIYKNQPSTVHVDRILNQKIPYNYGFVQEVPAADGDFLDLFICTNQPLQSLVECDVEIIGGFKCIDNGVSDDKLIGILVGEDVYPNVAAIRQYLCTYKTGFEVLGKLTEEDIKELLSVNGGR